MNVIFPQQTVLLLKTQTSEQSVDKYERLLVDNGFDVKLVNTLVFEYKNTELLAQKLHQHNSYSGIIFSSPRCVQALNLVCQNTDIDTSLWKYKDNFAVGKATSTEAFEKLGLECTGQDSGSAVNLLKYIVEGKKLYTKPFLYPHGNLKSDTFSKEGGKQGINVDGVLVYDTIDNPNVEDEIKAATNNFTEVPEFVIFFSPSGLYSSLNHLKKLPDFDLTKLIAIGPTTESAMRDVNLPVFGVAKQPSPQNILDIILSK